MPRVDLRCFVRGMDEMIVFIIASAPRGPGTGSQPVCSFFNFADSSRVCSVRARCTHASWQQRPKSAGGTSRGTYLPWLVVGDTPLSPVGTPFLPGHVAWPEAGAWRRAGPGRASTHANNSHKAWPGRPAGRKVDPLREAEHDPVCSSSKLSGIQTEPLKSACFPIDVRGFCQSPAQSGEAEGR